MADKDRFYGRPYRSAYGDYDDDDGHDDDRREFSRDYYSRPSSHRSPYDDGYYHEHRRRLPPPPLNHDTRERNSWHPSWPPPPASTSSSSISRGPSPPPSQHHHHNHHNSSSRWRASPGGNNSASGGGGLPPLLRPRSPYYDRYYDRGQPPPPSQHGPSPTAPLPLGRYSSRRARSPSSSVGSRGGSPPPSRLSHRRSRSRSRSPGPAHAGLPPAPGGYYSDRRPPPGVYHRPRSRSRSPGSPRRYSPPRYARDYPSDVPGSAYHVDSHNQYPPQSSYQHTPASSNSNPNLPPVPRHAAEPARTPSSSIGTDSRSVSSGASTPVQSRGPPSSTSTYYGRTQQAAIATPNGPAPPLGPRAYSTPTHYQPGLSSNPLRTASSLGSASAAAAAAATPSSQPLNINSNTNTINNAPTAPKAMIGAGTSTPVQPLYRSAFSQPHFGRRSTIIPSSPVTTASIPVPLAAAYGKLLPSPFPEADKELARLRTEYARLDSDDRIVQDKKRVGLAAWDYLSREAQRESFRVEVSEQHLEAIGY
ncbi:hypothetical protein V1514DRAFT_326949 [Lipomyces japonicus]|uniref:uncharacterized protein n=1 Tax=Lipomyces japonicus TaxID=56871 RepID=UPI0034CE3D8E